jgi:hypothetical protein
LNVLTKHFPLLIVYPIVYNKNKRSIIGVDYMPFGYEQRQDEEKKKQQESFKKYERKYVDVLCLNKADGTLIPKVIYFDSYHKYEVDKVLDIRQAPSLKSGGAGTRFLIKILGKETYIYYDEYLRQWFVDAKVMKE